jgi:hypothetical protein
MAVNDPSAPTRADLAQAFGTNQRLIKAFEKIFALIPTQFIDQKTQIDALELISALSDSRSLEAIESIDRLTAAVELIVLAPVDSDQPQAENDLTVIQEIGTIAAQNSDAVEISAGTVVAALTDSTTKLISSSVNLSSTPGAFAGTLLTAPRAGNPTHWAAVDNNGTTVYFPGWTV